MKNSDCILKVSNLGVKLNSHPILEKIDFKVKEGTSLSVVGPNGAGKTTLFKALLGLIPYTGRVEWSRKVKIGYVPQTFSVSGIPLSVREFLSFKDCPDTETCLNSVGLDPKKTLDKRIDVLSGGELQRVLVAWTIVDTPDVIFFDEPTTGIDVGSEEHIYEMIDQLREKYRMTIFMTSHDIHIIRHYSEQMLAIDRGMIFFGGSRKIVDPSLIRRIYGSATVLKKHHG